MSDILDIIRSRQSTRAYTGKLVDNELLKKILEAGRLSPSARNTQPWTIYCTSRKEVIYELGAGFAAIGRNLFVKDCGAFIAIVEEPLPEELKMHRRYAEFDIGMCIMQICLEAESLGVSSCILGSYDEDSVKAVLGIPKDKSVAMVIALGYASDPAVRPKARKSFDEAIKLV